MSRGPYEIVMVEPTGGGHEVTTVVGRGGVLTQARMLCAWAFEKFPGVTECRITDTNGAVETVRRGKE